MLLKHPEYLLYIFDEKEYEALKVWMELPQGVVTTNMQNRNVLIKALAMGLADFTVIDNRGEIRFATDGKHFMNAVEVKTRKNVYNLLHKFDDRMEQLIPAYYILALSFS